ncbi:MAG: hypothetical protein GY866_09515 [Proteobacteria bacterium]|nr:hypothetical protein [Pseudomonadota bacterium]
MDTGKILDTPEPDRNSAALELRRDCRERGRLYSLPQRELQDRFSEDHDKSKTGTGFFFLIIYSKRRTFAGSKEQAIYWDRIFKQ